MTGLILVVIFWMSVGVILFVYFGYPLLLWVASLLWGRPVRKKDILPPVSIIISAHNEEENIGATLENKLHLN